MKKQTKCKLCRRRKFDVNDLRCIKFTGHCSRCDTKEAHKNRRNEWHIKYFGTN